MKKFSILMIFMTFATISLIAQTGDWRRYREELVFGAGMSGFMGDLGGSKTIGSHSIKDYDFRASRWSFMAGYGYKLTDRFALRSALYYGHVAGKDDFTQEVARHGRNLSFRSPIIEVSEVVEFSILRERMGHRYDIKSSKGKKPMPNLYIFAGVGGFFFNPRGHYIPVVKDETTGKPLLDSDGNTIPDTDDPNYGKWYSLQPLCTEGQGYVPTRKKYSRVQFSIPLGIGLNYMLNKTWGIGFDLGYRLTLTDYIDDVSTTYVSPEIYDKIFADDPEKASIAKYFSDLSKETDGFRFGPGDQRGGNRNHDSYMFLTVKATYKIFAVRKGRSKF